MSEKTDVQISRNCSLAIPIVDCLLVDINDYLQVGILFPVLKYLIGQVDLNSLKLTASKFVVVVPNLIEVGPRQSEKSSRCLNAGLARTLTLARNQIIEVDPSREC